MQLENKVFIAIIFSLIFVGSVGVAYCIGFEQDRDLERSAEMDQILRKWGTIKPSSSISVSDGKNLGSETISWPNIQKLEQTLNKMDPSMKRMKGNLTITKFMGTHTNEITYYIYDLLKEGNAPYYTITIVGIAYRGTLLFVTQLIWVFAFCCTVGAWIYVFLPEKKPEAVQPAPTPEKPETKVVNAVQKILTGANVKVMTVANFTAPPGLAMHTSITDCKAETVEQVMKKFIDENPNIAPKEAYVVATSRRVDVFIFTSSEWVKLCHQIPIVIDC